MRGVPAGSPTRRATTATARRSPARAIAARSREDRDRPNRPAGTGRRRCSAPGAIRISRMPRVPVSDVGFRRSPRGGRASSARARDCPRRQDDDDRCARGQGTQRAHGSARAASRPGSAPGPSALPRRVEGRRRATTMRQPGGGVRWYHDAMTIPGNLQRRPFWRRSAWWRLRRRRVF